MNKNMTSKQWQQQQPSSQEINYTLVAIQAKYSPAAMSDYSNETFAISDKDSPTLGYIVINYGKQGLYETIMPLFISLDSYKGYDHKLTTFQIQELSAIIYTKMKWLKLSILMCYLQNLKSSSKYAKFFNCIDPTELMSGLNKFIHDLLDKEERMKNAEKEEQKPPAGYGAQQLQNYLKRKVETSDFRPTDLVATSEDAQTIISGKTSMFAMIAKLSRRLKVQQQ